MNTKKTKSAAETVFSVDHGVLPTEDKLLADNTKKKSERAFGILDSETCYRVFKKEHFIKMLRENKNTLVHVSKWDDPYEAFLLRNELINASNEKLSLKELYKDIYGQCWSLNQNETDATWRIYSPEKNGVLVKTTIGKLWDGFYDVNNPNAHFSFSIGKVTYHDEVDLLSEFRGKRIDDIISLNMEPAIQTLFLKRKEFQHENEVRLIFNDSNSYAQDGLYKYDIIAKDLIESVVADPRMNDDDYKCLENIVQSYNIEIKKSTLYQLPPSLLTW